MSFFERFDGFANSLHSHWRNSAFSIASRHGLDLGTINTDKVFMPVLPLMEKIEGQDSRVPLQYVNPFLEEASRSIAEKLNEFQDVFLPAGKCISATEAIMAVQMLHLRECFQAHRYGIEYIEKMIYRQVVAAVGKEVTPVDFQNYIKFHNRRLFKPEYVPVGFSYNVRRPDHFPEGTLSIEAHLSDGGLAEPIDAITCSTLPVRPIRFAIDAATTITMNGTRHLHSWMNTMFLGDSGAGLMLTARARQFSSFIMLLGRLEGAEEFKPKYGIIIQNKDDLQIPLLLEAIPGSSNWNTAIDSLSPEQQRFCRAYREMQVNHTMFGIAIIQIKPQLERLLNLPEDSLTKEIKLTQDVIKLFLDYHIPADLLSYAKKSDQPEAYSLTKVHKYVQRMQGVIEKRKDSEINEARLRAEYANRWAKLDNKPQPAVFRYPILHTPSSFHGNPIKVGAVSGNRPVQSPREIAEQHPAFDGEGIDYTRLPNVLDNVYAKLDTWRAIRPTVVNPSTSWNYKGKKNLLAPAQSKIINAGELRQKRNTAFDLLDSLTKAGMLELEDCSFHVFLTSTHSFEQTLIDTVVKRNLNPIEPVEHSILLNACIIHDKPVEELVNPDQLDRVRQFSADLFK